MTTDTVSTVSAISSEWRYLSRGWPVSVFSSLPKYVESQRWILLFVCNALAMIFSRCGLC